MKKGQNFWAVVKNAEVEKKNYTIRINADIGERFKERCHDEGVTMSDMVETFFKEQLEQPKSTKKSHK